MKQPDIAVVGDEYRASVGSVMDARKQYDEACRTQGRDSWPAQQAQTYLNREIEHRNEMRARYDAASGAQTEIQTRAGAEE
jgi:hypothetical protein